MSERQRATRVDGLHERAVIEIRVALARRRDKMSEAELGRRIGMRRQVLSTRMTGAYSFTLDELQDIASVLDVPVTALLGDAAATTPFIPQQRRRDLVA